MERRVVVVPAENAEFGKAAMFMLHKMGESEGALGFLVLCGNKEEITRLPMTFVCGIG